MELPALNGLCLLLTQGSQFTSIDFMVVLKKAEISI